MKHKYTNEIELKSLLIRNKNKSNDVKVDLDLNAKIRVLLEHPEKNKDEIIELSEQTGIDDVGITRLYKIVDIMCDHIMSKPNFSGYSWKDDFKSEAFFRVFKYCTSFDHKKVSKISGTRVNAFAYISQIIFNSILKVINKNNKEAQDLEKAAAGLDFSYFEADDVRTI